MKIGLYMGSWPQNIGNAFFDLGAKAILQKAFPNAEFFPLGGAVHWMFNASQRIREGRILTKIRSLADMNYQNKNSFELGQYADVDLIVFAGMSMCKEFVDNNSKTLLAASERGVAILGLGAGASLYTDSDLKPFSEFFNKLGNKGAIITRDEDTFNAFKNDIRIIKSGIDCAFFLPDYYTPPKLVIPDYDIFNFDAGNVPSIIRDDERLVLSTHHDLWGPLPRRYTNTKNTLVSDVPEDYLTLYSQVKNTYSDRVHACIATVAYGNSAVLYSDTPRKKLFEKVGLNNITKELCILNQDLISELKNKQVLMVRNVIEKMMG